MFETTDEPRAVERRIIEPGGRLHVLGRQAVDTAVRPVDPAGVVAAVIDSLFVHVRHVNAAIGADLDVDRPEPLVVSLDGPRDVRGLE